MAWQGLIRKRATRTFEGTVWMVIACAAAIWLARLDQAGIWRWALPEWPLPMRCCSGMRHCQPAVCAVERV